MENTNNSALSRVMSILFIVMGLFLWIYAFVAKAETRTLDGWIVSRNNLMSYLDPTFRNDSPSDYDIVTALYGTGDEGSIYTEHRNGYDSGSCLAAWMTVVRTWSIPTTIDPNTVYVLDAWYYAINATIEMADCSALTATGNVTIYKNTDFDAIEMSWITHAIIDNIQVDGDSYNENGFVVRSWTNNTMHAIISTNNGLDGIHIADTANIDLSNAESYNNANDGLYVIRTTNSYFMHMNAHNNIQDSIAILQSSDNSFTNITWANSMYGLWLTISSSWNNTFNRIRVFGNKLDGIEISNSHHNTGTNLYVYANGGTYHGWGIRIGASTYNVLTDAEIYSNTLFWLHTDSASNNTFQNLHIHDNGTYGVDMVNNSDYNNFSWVNNHENSYYGFSIESGDHNVLTGIESYQNQNHNIMLVNANYNTFTDIVANQSTIEMWLYMRDSSYNTFNGISAYGNYYAWVHLYNSNENAFTHTTSNSNEGWLYIEDSSDNNFEDITVNNSDKNWVVFSDSSYNTLSGLISSGNMQYGVYRNLSNNNEVSYSSLYQNLSWGLLSEYSSNNSLLNSSIQSNSSHGIIFYYWSWNIIDSSDISSNSENWISIWYTDNNQIINSAIDSNWHNGIYLTNSYSNIISGCNLSWNDVDWIELNTSSNTQIMNSNYFRSWPDRKRSIKIFDSTWTTITHFLWNKDIFEYQAYGDFQYTTYDSYTQTNNYILLQSNNTWINLTWSTIHTWSTFFPSFDQLIIWNDFVGNNFSILSWIASFTILWDNRDGSIYFPNQIVAWSKLWEIWETGTQSILTFIETIEFISWSSYLAVSWENIEITHQISSWISWQYINILKSNDWNNRNANIPNSSCILNQRLRCHFTTQGNIKLFAFWTPQMYFTGRTQGGTIITSGWLYNTGITISYTGLSISGATINGIPYVSNTLITGDNTYTFVLEDTNGNSTGITFTIDRTPPSFTGITQAGTPVMNGWYYATGITITFNDLHLSGATLNGSGYTSGTLFATEVAYAFVVSDHAGNTTGMNFTIDMTNPVVTGNYPASGLNITSGNDIVFTRSGYDTTAISWYILHISGTGTYDIYAAGQTSTVTLGNGNYTRYVEIIDRAGNTGASIPKSFTISTPLLPRMTLLTWNLKYNGGNRYTKDGANIRVRANTPLTYIFTGNFYNPEPPLTWGLLVNQTLTGRFNLSWSDGQKKIYLSITDGIVSTGTVFTIYLDTQAPIPTLTSPTSWSTVSWSTVPLVWWAVGADPSGAGLSGYQYFVADNSGTVISSGFTTSTSATISNLGIGTLGTFSRYVRAIDNVGNYGTSAVRYFTYSGTADTTPNSFSFNDIEDADLEEVYVSNTLTITGMTPGVQTLATITKWALYISGVMVGTSGYVQNGSKVKIELTSSDEYDESVSSTLTIWGISDTFKVTTKASADITDYEDIETDLSNTEKLMVISIFETLRDLYAGDKAEEFFNTFMLMLEDKMDEYDDNDSEYIALKYLYDIIKQYYEEGDFWSGSIDVTTWIINNTYTAPNGKKYPISYDSTRKRFTSSNFTVPRYFPTLDSLKYIIDINNPAWSQYANAKPIKARRKSAAIDGTRQSSAYTAPNRKVFYFFKDINGRYSSYTFTSERYFDSLEATKEFVHNSNLR